MLDRFQCTLGPRAIEGVETRRANVLELDGLPDTWTRYDLIVTASMLESLPLAGGAAPGRLGLYHRGAQ
jgi:hypothetical protein